MRSSQPVVGCLCLILGLALAASAHAQTVRVGVLKFGTVSWELDVVKHHELDTREGFELEVVPLGSSNALNVALQGNKVDIVVSDWIWVSRQRAAERDFTSFPYSLAVGSLMVRPDAGVDKLADLDGKRLGVAGGPVDKSWLLMRAYSREAVGKDLADLVEPVFAAPPLLNELMLKGDLPALINYWHYGARLKAAGMTPLLEVNDVLPALGVDRPVPLLVWVFKEDWAENHRALVNGFLDASYAAKRILAESDAEWERIEPLTKAQDEATLKTLRAAYRAGIPQRFGKAERAAAAEVFEILAREGGPELVGRGKELAAGTFWGHYSIEPDKR